MTPPVTWRDKRATFRRLPTLVIWEVRRDPDDRAPYTNGTESNMRKAQDAAAHVLRIMDRVINGDAPVAPPVSRLTPRRGTMADKHVWKKGDRAKYWTSLTHSEEVTLVRGPDRKFATIVDTAHGDAWHVTNATGERLVAYTSELVEIDDSSPWHPFRCDHCHEPVERDRNGYWVGPDKTSDCAKDDGGHTIEGDIRSW